MASPATDAGPSFRVLIPARLASTRLPNKPLADIAGLPMVVRVARQAERAGAEGVTVAADDAAIVATCERHGVHAILTRVDHATGSDRLAEACDLLALADETLVVNVQGDEPLVEPALIGACARALAADAGCVAATVAHAIDAHAAFVDPNVVKVVLDARRRALWFSRAPVPWPRDTPGALPPADAPALRHIGLYAYRAGFLRRFPTLPPSPHEAIERLEQLRILWHGERIAVHVTAEAPGIGVDTPEDLARVRRLLEAGGSAGHP